MKIILKKSQMEISDGKTISEINHSFHGLVRKLDTWEREGKKLSKPEDRSTEISQVSHKE